MTTLSDASAMVAAAERILLVTHIKPDGDAIGSMNGLALALRARGKDVTTAVDGGVPDELAFIPGADAVLDVLMEGEWDLMISLDSSDEERTGEAGVYGRAHSEKVLNIDHHPTNTMFGDAQIVVPTAVSTTEIVYDWLRADGVPLTVDVATALLTGLITDTRAFRTSNVNVTTLRIAQALMEAGAPYYDIIAAAMENLPYRTLTLWKAVLPSVELSDEGVLHATVSLEAVRATGREDSEAGGSGLTGLLSAVSEAKVLVVFKEQLDNKVVLSFRSRPDYDVGTLALKLGGGGHKQASGVTLEGTLDEVKARVLPLLTDVAQNGKPTLV